MRLFVDVEAAPPSSRHPPLFVLDTLYAFAFEVGGQFLAVELAGVGENTSLLLNGPSMPRLAMVDHDRQTTRLLLSTRQPS